MIKHIRRALKMSLILMLLCGIALAQVEMLCVNVGKGDAILLRAGAYCCMVDAGKKNAQPMIERALEEMGITRLDALFLTHTDKDHSGGLKWLDEAELEIGAVYASKFYPESSLKKHPAMKLAEARSLEVIWLGAGDTIAMGDSGAVLRVLAPEREISGNEDDHSLVMMLESVDGKILLAGDMEQGEEALLLDSGADLICDVLKVPNHGDGDACSPWLVEACAAKLAVISTDSKEKDDTPDPRVMRDLQDAGCEIYETEKTELGVYVTLENGSVTARELKE